MSSSMRHVSNGEQRLRSLVSSDSHSQTYSANDGEAAQRNRQLVTGSIVAAIALAILIFLIVL